MNKKKLYEQIMLSVSKNVKNKLMEAEYLDVLPDEIDIDVPEDEDYEDDSEHNEITVCTQDYGCVTLRPCFDSDKGDFYDVTDETGKWLCELPYDIDINDDSVIEDAIANEMEYADYEDDHKYDYEEFPEDEEDVLDDELEDDVITESFDDDYDEDALDDNEYDDYDEYDDAECDDCYEKYSLIGKDGNAFAIMGYIRQCMEDEGYSKEDIKAYLDDAKSGDYNHLLVVSQDMINQLNGEV